MRKVITSMICCLLLLFTFTSVAAAQSQSELDRLWQFIKDHPAGGSFQLQQDLLLDEVINTQGATYEIDTNGYQIQMKDDAGFTSEHEVDGNKTVYNTASFIIRGDASLRALVQVEGDVAFHNVEVEASNGIGVELEEDAVLNIGTWESNYYAKLSAVNGTALLLKAGSWYLQDRGSEVTIQAEGGIGVDSYTYGFSGGGEDKTSIIASGEDAIAIQFHTPYDENSSATSLSNVSLQVSGKHAIGIVAPWLRLSNCSIEYDTNEATAFNIERMITGFQIKINGVMKETYQILDGKEMGSFAVPDDMDFATVPLPQTVFVRTYSKEGLTNDVSLHLEYDETAFVKGMKEGKPFTLYASLKKEDAIIYKLADDVTFSVEIIPNQEPDFQLYFQKTQTTYVLKLPRPYNASHVYVYKSQDGKQWSTTAIDVVKQIENQYAIGSGELMPYASINGKLIGIDANYIKIVIEGGYLDGKSDVLALHYALTGEEVIEGEVLPPDGSALEDGSGEGNEGQGGGRGESTYQPPKETEKEIEKNQEDQLITKPVQPTISQDKQDSDVVEENKLEKSEQATFTERNETDTTETIIKDSGKQDVIELLTIVLLLLYVFAHVIRNRYSK